MTPERVREPRQKGFSLLEVLVALVVAAIALIASVGLLAECVRFSVRLREGAESCLEKWNRVQEIRSDIDAGDSEMQWLVPASGYPAVRQYRVVDETGRSWEVLRYDGSAPEGR